MLSFIILMVQAVFLCGKLGAFGKENEMTKWKWPVVLIPAFVLCAVFVIWLLVYILVYIGCFGATLSFIKGC